MKTIDKDAADTARFNAMAESHAKRSERIMRAQAAAQRPAGSEVEAGSIAVNVIAVERPGHDGFRRGGHFWPSDPNGIDVAVTPRLFQALDLEPLINVRRIDAPVASLESRDVPERFSIPTGGAEGAVTDRERSILAELAELKRQIAAFESKKKPDTKA